MSSVSVTPTTTSRVVVDTDVASYVFKWHPILAPRYIALIRGFELIISFMTVAEMRQGAQDANWGPRKHVMLDAYLADFTVLHSDNELCSIWAAIRSQSKRNGHPMSSADAWIAATSLALSTPLVTNNPKDYRHLDNLQLMSAVTDAP